MFRLNAEFRTPSVAPRRQCAHSYWKRDATKGGCGKDWEENEKNVDSDWGIAFLFSDVAS
jgi:hypothetical protein